MPKDSLENFEVIIVAAILISMNIYSSTGAGIMCLYTITSFKPDRIINVEFSF